MQKTYKIKIVLIIIIIVFTSIAAYFSDDHKSFSKKLSIKIDPNTKYEVVKVIDGDTFEIKVNKEIYTVRMLGIDTPETVDPRKVVQCFGREASDKTKELLISHSVTLETDYTQGLTDKYNRILAYVNRDDGLFINHFLIENGYAHEYTYNIPYKYQKEFKKLEKEAKKEKRGLWGSLCLQK